MSPQDFESRWNGGLRQHLDKVARCYLPAEEAEEAVSVVFYRLWRRVQELPEEGENGFKLGVFARHHLKLAGMQIYNRRERRVKETPLLNFVAGDMIESETLMQKAHEEYRETQRRHEGQYRAEAIYHQVKDPKNKMMLRLLSEGWTQREIAVHLGISRQALNLRYQSVKRKLKAAA